MGQVIEFPEQGRARDDRLIGMRSEGATVIILPVIRIERYTEEPDVGTLARNARRRRRRRPARKAEA
jgi:hypothetical protein